MDVCPNCDHAWSEHGKSGCTHDNGPGVSCEPRFCKCRNIPPQATGGKPAREPVVHDGCRPDGFEPKGAIGTVATQAPLPEPCDGERSCELCDTPRTCGHYCGKHHEQICVHGLSPRDIRAAEREAALSPPVSPDPNPTCIGPGQPCGLCGEEYGFHLPTCGTIEPQVSEEDAKALLAAISPDPNRGRVVYEAEKGWFGGDGMMPWEESDSFRTGYNIMYDAAVADAAEKARTK